MYLGRPRVPPFIMRNILHCCVLVTFIFFRISRYKVSYDLCIISIVLMTGLIILWVNVVVV